MDHLIVRDGCLLFFDKVDAFVPESARPVRVYVEVAGNVWGDHHRLWLVAVEKCLQEINIMHHFVCLLSTYLQILSLFVKDDDLVPLVRLQPHRLEGVLLDELHPTVLVAHLGEEILGNRYNRIRVLNTKVYSPLVSFILPATCESVQFSFEIIILQSCHCSVPSAQCLGMFSIS